MLQTVGYIVLAVFALRVFAALLAVLLQSRFGPIPPPHMARLMDACIDVFRPAIWRWHKRRDGESRKQAKNV